MRPTRATNVLAVLGASIAAGLYALPATAAAESCPNAVLRSGQSSRLPDCRAYEMVTPPYKEGFPVYVGTGGFASNFSADGSGMAGESIGVFAGAEDSRVEVQESFIESGAGYVFHPRGEPAGNRPRSARRLRNIRLRSGRVRAPISHRRCG